MFDYKCETAGEQLAAYIERELVCDNPFSIPVESFQWTGRRKALTDFFHEIAVVHLTCRLILFGNRLFYRVRKNATHAENSFIFISKNNADYNETLREYLISCLSGIDISKIGQIKRLVDAAVLASTEKFSKKEKKMLTATFRKLQLPCYMCGQPFSYVSDKHYTIEHIWPRRYGGNSIIENALPACHSCNNIIKKDYPTWAFPDIQALLRHAPQFGGIRAKDIFSMHYRKARESATKENISLKDAFLKIGSWDKYDYRMLDEDDLCDYFNLEFFKIV